MLLHRVFGGQETGFYVDVGAYDPVDGSVTKTFYDRGWSGINIEPGTVFEKLAAARPRDVNLQMVVLDKTGEVAFADVATDLGMSHVVLDGQSAHARVVACDTLENIVHAHSHGRPVDFLKIDAEGAESAIVHSTDWRRFRPRVIVLEATRPWSTVLCNQDWEPALLEQGFVRVFFDGVNCFYVNVEEHVALERHFRVPVNVLDRVTRHDVMAAKRAAEAAAEEQQLRAELASARDALERSAELQAAHEQLHVAHNARVTEAHDLRATLSREQERAATAERQHCDVVQQRDVLSKEYADVTQRCEALGAEHTALLARFTTCSSEVEILRSAHDASEARCDALAAESEVLHEEVQALRSQGEVLTVHQSALRSRYEASATQRDMLCTEKNTLVAERDALASERAALTARVEELTSARERPHASFQSDEDGGAPTTHLSSAPPIHARASTATRPPTRSVKKRIGLFFYKIVRPVVRPMVWRARSFIVSGVAEQIDVATLRVKAHVHDAHAETIRELDCVRQATVIDLPRLVRQVPQSIVQTHPVGEANPAGVEELRQLANEVENAMLALALLPSDSARAAPVAVRS